MPLFRVHWANTDAEEGQWRTDTIGRFRERYFNNDGPTPYVWAENPDTLIWDLSFSNFVPRDGQGEGVHYLVLCDGDNWIELGNRFLGFGWSAYPHRGDASVFTAIHALEQFEVKVMPDPEQVRLTVQAGIRTRSIGPPGTPGRDGRSSISVSMAFGREHEPVLQDLRLLLERRGGRRLTRQGTPPPDDSWITAGTGDPGIQEIRPYPEPATSSPDEPPDGPAAAHEKEEPAGLGAQDEGVALGGRRSRPGARTLALAVESVPDTPEWLSFSGPTTAELLAIPSTDADVPDHAITASSHDTGQAADR
jgi:hypothetical protein